MKRILVTLITLYQRTLSPDHGIMAGFFPFGCCRFYPSCSTYMKDGVVRRGVTRGLLLGLWRIIRCHPWSTGGIDKP